MCLLDTHTLIWFLFDDSKMSDVALNLVSESEKAFVSIVSLWEIAIKQSIKKLEIKSSIAEIVENCHRVDIRVLEMKPKHLDRIKELPFIHNDPFDRLIIAQAMEENLVLITNDSIIPKYNVRTIW